MPAGGPVAGCAHAAAFREGTVATPAQARRRQWVFGGSQYEWARTLWSNVPAGPVGRVLLVWAAGSLVVLELNAWVAIALAIAAAVSVPVRVALVLAGRPLPWVPLDERPEGRVLDRIAAERHEPLGPLADVRILVAPGRTRVFRDHQKLMVETVWERRSHVMLIPPREVVVDAWGRPCGSEGDVIPEWPASPEALHRALVAEARRRHLLGWTEAEPPDHVLLARLVSAPEGWLIRLLGSKQRRDGRGAS